ncbi:MAG: T9SS type A sorting domain-containing protein, partial [Legionellales bacterium]
STRTKIALPATCPSSWASSYKFDINFKLTVAIASYSLTPGYIRSYVTEKDTVIGWGKMRIKTLAGTPSGYMNVLQVRTMTTTLDSFFVNGLPAAPTLLSALSLTQGQITKTYEQNFYRVNEVTPLAYVQFSDSANTTPTKVTTHVQRLLPNAVPIVFNDANVKIYPNPVSGRNVSIDVPVTTGEWKYELVNISGQAVAADRLQLSNNQTHTQIQFSASLVPGIYYIRLINDGKQVVVKPLEIK